MKFTPLPRVLFWICGLVLSRLALALPLVLWFGGAFPWLRIRGSKVLLLLLKFLLNLGGIVICLAKWGNVEELHFLLNVSMKTAVVLEHQMSLWIFNTQLCAQGMEQIHQFVHILIPLLPQHGPLDVLVLIAPHGVILFLMPSWNEFQVGAAKNREGSPSSFCSQ